MPQRTTLALPGKHCTGRGARGARDLSPALFTSAWLSPELRAEHLKPGSSARPVTRCLPPPPPPPSPPCPPIPLRGCVERSGCGLTRIVPGRAGAEPHLSPLQRGAASSPTRVEGRTFPTGRRQVSHRASEGSGSGNLELDPPRRARSARCRTKASPHHEGLGAGATQRTSSCQAQV